MQLDHERLDVYESALESLVLANRIMELRAINPKHNPTQETLGRLLKPFGLRIGLAQIKQRRKGRTA